MARSNTIHAGSVFSSPQNITNGAKEFGLFCKDVTQGLMSGVMAIAGALQLAFEQYAASNFTPILNGTSFEGVLDGKSFGVIQIAVAGLLFFSARRGIARTTGLLALFGYIALNNYGVTVDDFASQASSALIMLGETLNASG